MPARLVNAASLLPDNPCSPGAAAMFIGDQLFIPGSDEVRVEVNGQAVPVFSASTSRVVFECPDLSAGTSLSVVLMSGSQRLQMLDTQMHEASPGIFTINGDGTGAGVILANETVGSTTGYNENVAGSPVQESPIVSLLVTGIGQSFGFVTDTVAQLVSVTVDGLAAEVMSTQAIGSGVYQLDVRTPRYARTRGAVVHVEIPLSDGKLLRSNGVEVTVE